MKKKPSVSVVMSVYNESQNELSLAIESILNQSFTNFEFIIIIDNPQNKIALNLINNYKIQDSRIKCIINNQNMGLVKSLNKGISFATGKYIARMDADDISLNSRLKRQYEFLENHPNIDLISSNAEIMDEKGNYLYVSNHKILSLEKARNSLKYNNVFIHPTWFFKKSIFNELGGYREIPYCEDYDFLCRLFLNNFNALVLNDILLKYRIRENGLSNSHALKQKKNMCLINKQYKKNINNKNSERSIKFKPCTVTAKEEEKYLLSKEKWNKAIYFKKNNNYVKCVVNLIISLIYSKYMFINIKNSILAKIKL